jgi:hypothetical protein
MGQWTVKLPPGTIPATLIEAVQWCKENAPSADTTTAEAVLRVLDAYWAPYMGVYAREDLLKLKQGSTSLPVSFYFDDLVEATHFKLRFG